MESFGAKLRQCRRASGLSQRKLAHRVGVDFSYISKLENNRLPPPSSETITRLANTIDVDAAELLAAARKLPDTDELASQPEAQRFVKLATNMQLSGDEWERMLGKLHELRDDAADDSL